MAPAPQRTASSERSVHTSLRVSQRTTYSFAQQLPGPLAELSRTPAPAPPGAVQAARTTAAPASDPVPPGVVQVSKKPAAPATGRWAAGLPKTTTAAEVVANSSSEVSSNQDEDIAGSLDAELDLYSRLVPTTSAVPRNPRRPLGGGGLRGTGSIASGTASATGRSASSNSSAVLHSHVLTVHAPHAPSSSKIRSLSPPSARMQSLSTDSSSSQLARRAVTGHKLRRPVSLESPPPVDIDIPRDDSVSPPDGPQESASTLQSLQNSSTTLVAQPREPPAHQYCDQQKATPRALEPVPLRRDQIEVLRNRTPSGGSGTSCGSVATPLAGCSPPKTNSAPVSRSSMSSNSDTVVTRKSLPSTSKSPPLPRPQNARADAMREALLRKSSSGHATKSVHFTRSAMGSSLSPKRSELATNGLRVTKGAVFSANTHPTEALPVTPVADHEIKDEVREVHAVGVRGLDDVNSLSGDRKPEVGDVSFLGESESRVVENRGKKGSVQSWRHAANAGNGVESADSGQTEDQEVNSGLLPFVNSVLSPPVSGHAGATIENVNYLRDPSVLSNGNYSGGTARGDLFVQGLVGSELVRATGSLPVENLSLNDIMIGLYSGKESPMHRGVPFDHEPIEDGLLPPLPNSEREDVRFESMLRSMGWQPLEDEDSTVITNLR